MVHKKVSPAVHQENLPISELIFDQRNANRGTQRGRAAIAESLQKYGAGRSILIDRNNKLIAGNKTTEVAGEIGLEDVIVVETDGSKLVAVKRTDLDLGDQTARSLAIYDNRTSELSLDWDPEILAQLSEEIDLSGLWTDGELVELLADLNSSGGTSSEENDEDVADLIGRADQGTIELCVQPGELWQLGRHRLLCGDSTDPGAIAHLMGGKQAHMVWTDPPYNVNYDPEKRDSPFSKERLNEGRLGTIENDCLNDTQFRSFLDATYQRISESLLPGSAIYICHADLSGHHSRNAFIAQGWNLHSCLIWVKTVIVFGYYDYHWKHEPILYGWKQGAAHRFYGDRKQTTILEFAAPHYDQSNCDTKGYVHSCQKPTPLIEYCLGNSSRPGEIVLDLFGGSGSTLIAAERSDRVSYICELDPRFASVIWQRFVNFTGQEPELIGGTNV